MCDEIMIINVLSVILPLSLSPSPPPPLSFHPSLPSLTLSLPPPSLSLSLSPPFSFHRAGTPDEISGIVSFLASDDASYITGENILVAGGAPSRL